LHSRYYSGGVDSGINSDVESNNFNYSFRQDNTLTLTYVTSEMVSESRDVFTKARTSTLGVGGQIVSLTTGVYTKLAPSISTIMHQSVKNPISSTGILELVEDRKPNKAAPLGLLDLADESPNYVLQKRGVFSRTNMNVN
uniref:Apolipoprotein B n=1 Tax=Romanomermis culicivorax TaxID=13658 RepID=A0A915J6U0_ROMCU